MKKFFLPTLFCILNFSVLAQSSGNDGFTIKGRLIDSVSNRPLEYATVSIFIQDAKKPVNGAISDNKGNFVVNKVAAGKYKLVAEFIGYSPHTIYNISVNKGNRVVNVGDINLTAESYHTSKYYYFRPAANC